MRFDTAVLALALLAACADPPPPIGEPAAPEPASLPAGATLPPPSNGGIAGSGPDQAPLPKEEAAPAPEKKEEKPLDPGAPDPKTGSSAKCNSALTFSVSEWKKIDATKKEIDFDVVSNVEGEVQVLDHETDAVIEAGRSVEKDPVTGGQPEGSFRGISAVSGQRLLLRADWGDCLVVVVP